MVGRCKLTVPMKPIPAGAAEHIAKTYGYDQVVIIARRVDAYQDAGGEHVTTYGRNKAHCQVAAHIGDFLKFKVMGWTPDHASDDVAEALDSLKVANERIKELKEVLLEISRQKLSKELRKLGIEGCFEEGYDTLIKLSRAELSQTNGDA